MTRSEAHDYLLVLAALHDQQDIYDTAKQLRHIAQMIRDDGERIHHLNERLLETNREVTDLTWRLERLRP
jgi:DNA-directed RNA polymerase subunit F